MERLIADLSVLVVGAAVLASLAVFLKQPIIIAYVVWGVLVGPWGLGWIKEVRFIENISHLGITLLLFLAGLNLHPQKLLQLFKKTTLVTFTNCVFSFLLASGVSYALGFHFTESLCIGLALMFSSTILVVKLLPTLELHHERMGAVCIGVLIMEDLLAIAVLVFLRCLTDPAHAIVHFAFVTMRLILFIVGLIVIEIFLLRRVMARVERLHEVLFILGLAWCFGIASISNHMGLFHESGAFFAGVVLARQPISRFIADRLRPLRDFFLVLFFFALGAKLNLYVLKDIFPSALVLALLFIVVKPLVFMRAFIWTKERAAFAKEAGIRLGQLSEFSILIAVLALDLKLIGPSAAYFIQLVTIFTFIISSYVVIYRYPTPIGTTERLIKD